MVNKKKSKVQMKNMPVDMKYSSKKKNTHPTNNRAHPIKVKLFFILIDLRVHPFFVKVFHVGYFRVHS